MSKHLKIQKFTNYRLRSQLDPNFKQLLPASLKDKVSNTGKGKKVHPCMQEMSQMLACLKTVEFNEQLCSKEITSFNQCQQKFQAMQKSRAEKVAKGIVILDKGKFPPDHVNKLLEKYPQPKKVH